MFQILEYQKIQIQILPISYYSWHAENVTLDYNVLYVSDMISGGLSLRKTLKRAEIDGVSHM